MNTIIKNKIFICATEQSGDNIGSKIIEELKINNTFVIDGVGGRKISKLINKTYFNLNDFKSIGIIEILGSIKKYLSMIEFLSNKIISNNYDMVITIDSPDFNYRLAKNIKSKGFKGNLIHIVAPSVWAWRKGRAKKFAEVYDKLLTIFPFEKKYFQKYKLPTVFIGNPIYYINNFKNIKNKKYIAFLPGSRESEIVSLIKYFKIASDYLDSISSELIVFIPTLNHLKKKLLNLTKDWNNKPIIETEHLKIENLFKQTSVALVCSGSATLEIVKRNIPQLIVYKMNYFTELILKFFVKVKYANIINIMADKMIIPEITNSKLNNNNFLKAFKKLTLEYKNKNFSQLKNSLIYINQLVLKQPPAKIASKEIEMLLLPKPLKD